MKTIRQKIIGQLREHRVSTAGELSRILNLTAADVRHHLALLNQQGTIAIVGNRKTNLRGRPPTLYMLTENFSRHNLALLTHFLLVKLSTQGTSADYHKNLKEIARLFASNAHWDLHNMTRRIYLTVNYLNNLNYDAAWEAHSDSPHFIFGHCPFSPIIDQHRDLCLMDAYLLEILIGRKVQQLEKLTVSTQGLPHCVFILQDHT